MPPQSFPSGPRQTTGDLPTSSRRPRPGPGLVLFGVDPLTVDRRIQSVSLGETLRRRSREHFDAGLAGILDVPVATPMAFMTQTMERFGR